MKEKIKIFILGGHFSPALAVIEEMEKTKDFQIYFLGRIHPLEGDKSISAEYRVIKEKKNVTFLDINTGRLQRQFTPETLLSLLKIPFGFFQAIYYLVKYRPQIILSFGSYVSLPVSMIGFFLNIPVIIHEQTHQAGMANRITGLWAKRICLSYKDSQKYFLLKKTIITGLPLRPEIFQMTNPVWQKSIGKPLLYITGGSLGSRIINSNILPILDKLLLHFYIIHQAGRANNYSDLDLLKKQINSFSQLKSKYYLTDYLKTAEIGWVLNKADIVISRAGANTVAELIALNKPSIIIPISYSEEQKANAFFAQEKISAIVLQEENLTPENIYQTVMNLYSTLKESKKASNINGKASSVPAQIILKEIYEATKRS